MTEISSMLNNLLKLPLATLRYAMSNSIAEHLVTVIETILCGTIY